MELVSAGLVDSLYFMIPRDRPTLLGRMGGLVGLIKFAVFTNGGGC